MILIKIFLTVLLCFVTQINYTQDQQKLFSRGNELFLQRKYQDAFNVYERITDKGFVVFYNMGICGLRQNKKSETILCMKRAEKQAASYKEFSLVDEVLEFNEKQEIIDKSWSEKITTVCRKSMLALSMLVMQLIVLLGLIFLIVIWYRRFYVQHKKTSALFVMLWFVLYFILSYKINFMQKKYGVVMEASIPVLAGPDDGFYKQADLQESTLIAIIGQQNQYYKVALDKHIGWIHSQNIELV